MKSNDWGDTQEIEDDKWEDFSNPSSSQLAAPSKSSSGSNASSWVQDKPAPSQTKNDWDTDAFFNDVLSTSTKPKQKTTRRQ
jgi:hypothetical protein